MAFIKGVSGNKNGRPKGSSNKTTLKVRERIQEIVSTSLDTLQDDLEKMDPEARVKFSIQLMEFITPKLQRSSFDLDTGNKNTQLLFLSAQNLNQNQIDKYLSSEAGSINH